MDWVFPPHCAACGDPGHRLCNGCQAKIKFFPNNIQLDQKKGLSKGNQSYQPENAIPPGCSDSRHVAYYEGVIRECIHALKYQNNQGLGEMFADWLVGLVQEAGWRVDLVIPVPLSSQRLHERGYNQSAAIARPLALKLGCRYTPHGLKRIHNTPSQVGLSAAERHRNVALAFKAEPDFVRLQSILLVDDVMTTGATLGACAQELKRAGASLVFAVTVARLAIGFPEADLMTHQV